MLTQSTKIFSMKRNFSKKIMWSLCFQTFKWISKCRSRIDWTSWSDKFQGCFISFIWSQNKILSRISKLRIYYSVSLLPGKSFTGYVFSTIHSDLVTELFNEETKDISGLFRCVLSNNIDSVNTRVNTINVHTMPNVA